MTALLDRVVHWPVAGLHSSVVYTASVGSLNVVPPTPPVANTSPVGSTVRLRCRRGADIEPVHFQAGAAASRSMTSAVLVVRDPPAYRTLPCSYMTAAP